MVTVARLPTQAVTVAEVIAGQTGAAGQTTASVAVALTHPVTPEPL